MKRIGLPYLSVAPSGAPAWDSLSDDATNIANYALAMGPLGLIGLLVEGPIGLAVGLGAGYLVAPNLPVIEPAQSGSAAAGASSGLSANTTVLLLAGLLGVALYAKKV